MKYAFVEKNRRQYGVPALCEALQVSRSLNMVFPAAVFIQNHSSASAAALAPGWAATDSR